MSTDLLRLTVSLADRYRIERELGQGEMATVYLANDFTLYYGAQQVEANIWLVKRASRGPPPP